MQSKNILFIISGPSGSGKTTTMREVMSNEIISFTTRAKREGEVEGIDYIYITQKEFEELFAQGDIAESTTYYGTASYGITLTELMGKIEKGDAFVIVDVVGKAQLEELYPNTVAIFFNIDKETAIARMRFRGDGQESIDKRLKSFDEELENFYLYDYVVDNNGSRVQSMRSINFIIGMERDKRNVPTEI